METIIGVLIMAFLITCLLVSVIKQEVKDEEVNSICSECGNKYGTASFDCKPDKCEEPIW